MVMLFMMTRCDNERLDAVVCNLTLGECQIVQNIQIFLKHLGLESDPSLPFNEELAHE